MVGASAVGVCTAAILKGPQVYGKIAREIDAWLDAHGYTSVEDVRGLAIQRRQEREFRTHHVPPTINVDTCTGCGLCEASCVYDAIHVVNDKAEITPEACYGCGLCVTRCPVRALSIT
jgi:heterodisulfide reductase subunit A-like polyferredoxin